MEFRADLHCHSLYSDGTLSPKELIDLAKEKKLQGLSITDHDTIKGYSQEVFSYAQEKGIRLLCGVEISSSLQEQTVHILAYGRGVLEESLQKFLSEVVKKRKKRNEEIVDKLNEHGLKVDVEEIYQLALKNGCAETVIGRPHIANLLVEKGYVKNFQEAFQKYLQDGGLCYVSGMKFSPDEVIGHIHQVKAKAVLAHPHVMSLRLVDSVLEYPFDGIEAYYGRKLPIEEKKWIKIAKDRNLIATGGSDFHGLIKPHLSLGVSWVGIDTFNLLAE